MLYSLEAVKANIRNRDGKRVFYLGKNDHLTSEAKDHLTRERIEILPADLAKPQRYRLLSGGYTEEKPEHMTHLHGDVLVAKNHPRIRFRGAVDSLEAALLNCQRITYPQEVGEILKLARYLIRCDVLNEPVGEQSLCGLTQAQIRQQSHFPQEHFGIAHFMPEYTDGPEILALNSCRCAVRETELVAVEAYMSPEGTVTRPDIIKALNRMSSMLYILMLRHKATKRK